MVIIVIIASFACMGFTVMPTLNELLERVSFLASMPAVAGVLITACLLVIVRDWRVNIIALAVQYFFVVLLLSQVVRPEIAAVKGLIGWLVCMVFYVTERRASVIHQTDGQEEVPESKRWRRWVMSARASFRLLASLLVVVVAYSAVLRFPLPEIASYITLACYFLVGLGLLLLGLSEEPMQVGIGLLTVLSGSDLFYVALEPSLAVAGLVGILVFVIALVVTYLRAAQVSALGIQEGS